MPKLRVIQGGKLSKSICTTKVRLFSAFSLIDNYQGHDMVRLNWIRLGRKEPLAPVESMVNGYEEIDPAARRFFDQYLMELFTEPEIDSLKSCLKDSRLIIHEESLPMESLFIPMPYRELSPAEGRGFYYLPEAEQQSLPFKVCAYFDLRKCPASTLLQETPRVHGMTFLREAFKSLGLEPQVSVEQMHEVVEGLYDRLGLFVERGKTKAERLKEKEQAQ